MASTRSLPGTPRFAQVTAAALALALLVGALAPAPASAGEPPTVDVARELRRAARPDLAPSERLAAAQRALSTDAGGESDLWLRAAGALVAEAPESAAWLARRGLAEGVPDPDAVNRLAAALKASQSAAPSAAPADAARAAALRLLLGQRDPGEALVALWPPEPFVRAVLEDEVGRVGAADGSPRLAQAGAQEVVALVREVAAAAADLDRACSFSAEESAAGLDALLAAGGKALALLLHEARRAAVGVPPGRLDRALKALAVLGIAGDRAATPALIACLESPHGFVRAAAASALGDLGDPAAAVALARQLVYAGDPFRARESWDYPGTTETPIRPEDWPTVEYYAIDCAAADALLQMGARGAAGWLIRNALDPRRRNVRIRVPQDALDALERHLTDATALKDYEVEAGLPQRERACAALSAWWRAHRRDASLLRRAFAEDDPGFVRAARGLAERLGQPKVLELMIAKDACEVLGAPLTPILAEALASARSGGHKAELALALGRVNDPRAATALRTLLTDKAGFVRAKAAEALGAYAGTDAQVVAALLAALEDPDCGCRQAALGALVSAPVSPAVREAARTHDVAGFAALCGESPGYAMAREVVLLVQEGEEHLEVVLGGLRHADRVVRRSWWDLLRVALDLDERLVDWSPAPGAPGARPLDVDAITASLRERREVR